MCNEHEHYIVENAWSNLCNNHSANEQRSDLGLVIAFITDTLSFNTEIGIRSPYDLLTLTYIYMFHIHIYMWY